MKSDPFEHIRRIQDVLDRWSILLQPMQNQFQIMQPIVDQMRIVQQSYSPMLDAIRRQQDLMEAASIGATLGSSLVANHELLLALERLSTISHIHTPIPDAIYPKLDLLINELEERTPTEGNSDLVGSITVNKPETDDSSKQLTWGQLLQILLIVYQVLFPIYSDYQSSNQNERQHREQLEQVEQHHREMLEQNERHFQEEMEQREQHLQKELEQSERHHREKMILLCQELLTACEQYLQNDQDTVESDQTCSDIAQSIRPDED